MHDTRPFCATLYYVDLPQVDHGEGGRGVGSARLERRSCVWSTCVACRNLNRIKNFGANNFYILKVCTFHKITSPRRQWVYTNTKTFSRIDISWSSNETVCTKCGNEITDPSEVSAESCSMYQQKQVHVKTY